MQQAGNCEAYFHTVNEVHGIFYTDGLKFFCCFLVQFHIGVVNSVASNNNIAMFRGMIMIISIDILPHGKYNIGLLFMQMSLFQMHIARKKNN